MSESSSIGELAMALSKAQAKMGHAKKETENPFFKSKYADLASVIEVAREPLGLNSLCYVQYVQKDEKSGIGLVTKLMHSSGQWIDSFLPLVLTKNDMQGLGSAISYARRYGLSSMLGIAQEDDDGNHASQRGKVFPSQPEPHDGVYDPTSPYLIPGGKYVKRKFSEIDTQELKDYIHFIEDRLKKDASKKPYWWEDFIVRADGYLGDLENQPLSPEEEKYGSFDPDNF